MRKHVCNISEERERIDAAARHGGHAEVAEALRERPGELTDAAGPEWERVTGNVQAKAVALKGYRK
jgi:hypothetical protein